VATYLKIMGGALPCVSVYFLPSAVFRFFSAFTIFVILAGNSGANLAVAPTAQIVEERFFSKTKTTG
jgi:hypothetical protein